MRPTAPAERRSRRRRDRADRPDRPIDDGTTERIRLIEFVWTNPGRQPVLYVDREWLH